MLIRFEAVSRPAKRNCKLGVCHRPAKLLIRLPKAKWVPNGPSEWPQRKSGVRERFRASGPSPRCTAIREKRSIPGLFRADHWAERVLPDGVLAEGEELSSNPLCRIFNDLRSHNCGGCCFENLDTTSAMPIGCSGEGRCRQFLRPGDLPRGAARCALPEASRAESGASLSLPPRPLVGIRQSLSAPPCKEDWPSFENGRMPQRRRCPAGVYCSRFSKQRLRE
jgi:hypothetical protein